MCKLLLIVHVAVFLWQTYVYNDKVWNQIAHEFYPVPVSYNATSALLYIFLYQTSMSV
jgi:hypothetical protein